MWGEGVKRKRRGGVLGLENAFELGVTCRLTRSSCVNRTHGGTSEKTRGQIAQVIKMPLILACPPEAAAVEEEEENKNTSAQEVLTSKHLFFFFPFPAYLCQPVFRVKNAVSFGKHRRLTPAELRGTAACHRGVAQWDILRHSHSGCS